jgi:hypothetical protein
MTTYVDVFGIDDFFFRLLSQTSDPTRMMSKKAVSSIPGLPQTGLLCKKSVVPPLFFDYFMVFILGSPEARFAQTALEVRAGGCTQEAPEGRSLPLSVASLIPEGDVEASDRPWHC